jgi:hypothetical protein
MLEWDYCHEKAVLPTYFWQKVAISCRKPGQRCFPHTMKLPREGQKAQKVLGFHANGPVSGHRMAGPPGWPDWRPFPLQKVKEQARERHTGFTFSFLCIF